MVYVKLCFCQVEHPQKTKRAVWNRMLSKQRKRAVVACLRMAPLYNLPRFAVKRVMTSLITLHIALWITQVIKAEGSRNTFEQDILSSSLCFICLFLQAQSGEPFPAGLRENLAEGRAWLTWGHTNWGFGCKWVSDWLCSPVELFNYDECVAQPGSLIHHRFPWEFLWWVFMNSSFQFMSSI